MDAIPEGSFVLEYVGEIVTNQEAERRGRMYDSVGCSHLFDLDMDTDAGDSCFFRLYGPPCLPAIAPHVMWPSIDATKMGNSSRFINHSCDPNLQNYQALSFANLLNFRFCAGMGGEP